MEQPINVVLLLTEDKANIFQCRNGQILYTENTGTNTSFSTYIHLYATVSQDVEAIKEGDFYIHMQNGGGLRVRKCIGDNLPMDSRKIIATTDPKLTTLLDDNCCMCDNERRIVSCTTKDRFQRCECITLIPQVQQSFLKEFVANPDGEYKIEYETKDMGHCTIKYDRYLIIVKLNQDNTVNITSLVIKRPNRKEYINKKTKNQLIADLELHIDYLENTYINPVKEKRYNREEIENLATRDFKALIPYPTNLGRIDAELKKWIKENL
tara:strand:- start:426 stop:1226 length:801 start_codon:yes stop_codon:yes gene_type:complete